MRNRQAGYALLVVLLMAALVLIALSAAVPRLLTQGQREKEEELVFRGQQYQRAIKLFYKKYGRFPRSVDELLRTNDRSFLRRAYPDPMSPDGRWRYLRVGPGGEWIGSVNTHRPPGASAASPSSPDESSGGPSPYPLAGVASRSRAPAIRVYEDHTHYYEWEFVYDPVKDAARGGPGVPAQPAQPPVPTPPR